MKNETSEVDNYFTKLKMWREESQKLRELLLDGPLKEELKWGKPCYTFAGNNVVVLQGFKAYCALLFFKGMLLKDPDKILVKTGENTRVGRQIRFTDVRNIVSMKSVLRSYLDQAIALEKSGAKVPAKKNEVLILPDEFVNALQTRPTVKVAFDALTPGRQRAYSLYFSAPKQSKTRASRVENCVPLILSGKGLND